MFEGQASWVVGCLLVGEGLLKCCEELLAGDMERLQVFGVGRSDRLLPSPSTLALVGFAPVMQ